MLRCCQPCAAKPFHDTWRPSLGVGEQGPDTTNSQGATIIGSAHLFMSSGHITGSPWSSEVWVSMSCSSHLPSIFLLFPSSWPLAPLVSSLVSPGLVLFDVHDTLNMSISCRHVRAHCLAPFFDAALWQIRAGPVAAASSFVTGTFDLTRNLSCVSAGCPASASCLLHTITTLTGACHEA